VDSHGRGALAKYCKNNKSSFLWKSAEALAAPDFCVICQEAWYLHWRIKMFGKGQKLRKAANVIGLRKQLNVCGLRARLCNKRIVKNVR